MTDSADALPSGDVMTVDASKMGADLSPMEAARALNDLRFSKKDEEQPAQSAEAEKPATAEPELPTGNAGPEEVPSEAETTDQEAQLPPIEPPRSWTKEDKELFNGLPRDTQERIAERERSRERDFLQRQQEAAEKLKGLTAKEQAIENERKQYVTALSSEEDRIQKEIAATFPNIKSMADVEWLTNEAFRLASTGRQEDAAQSQQISTYLQLWNAKQQEIAVVRAQKTEADQKQTQERQTKRSSYEQEQNKRLAELVPDMKDPVKGAALRDKAVKMLTEDLKIPGEVLSKWYGDDTGHEILSHASIQKLIVDGLRYQEIQQAKATVTAKPLPPAQRPGAGKVETTSNAARIEALQKQQERATGMEAIRIGAEITKLRRAG